MSKEESKLFDGGLEEYPISTVIIENTLMLLWLLIGSYLCGTISPLTGWIYLGFGLSMVLVVMRILVCGNCYYHGKICHTGWGKLSALYCKQGDIRQFGCGAGGAIVPGFYGSMALLPVVLGIISLVQSFSILNLAIMLSFIVIVILSSHTFRKKACVQCKMKDICPGSLDKSNKAGET